MGRFWGSWTINPAYQNLPVKRAGVVIQPVKIFDFCSYIEFAQCLSAKSLRDLIQRFNCRRHLISVTVSMTQSSWTSTCVGCLYALMCELSSIENIAGEELSIIC